MAVNAEQLLYRSPGGIGRYTAQLLTVVPAAFPDCEIIPLTARHPGADVDEALAEHGVPVATRSRAVRQRLPRPLLYETWARFGRPALTGVGPDTLVHAPSVAVPPRSGRGLVVTVHDAAPEIFPDAFPARGRRFHRLGLEAAARRADLVITVSQAAAEELVTHSAIPADRIRVVPNGVDPPGADPGRDHRMLERFGLHGRPYVLWVGSLEPRKGVGTLVRAMALLARRGRRDDPQTVLAGYDGWLNEGILAAEDVSALGPALRRLGRVSEEELWALYRAAAVFAMPSRHEGFGLPVVEAMSQSVPVVASDIPALREVGGPAVLLVDPASPEAWADAIEGLLDDEGARLELGRAGRDRSRMFSAEAMAAGTRAVYGEIGS